jgi:hypothetical protein
MRILCARKRAEGWEMGDPDQNPNSVPTEEPAFSLSPKPATKTSKRNPVAGLPQFAIVDIDTIHIDPGIEKCLRELGINSVFASSHGLLTKQSLLELALQEPVQVEGRKGHWTCIGGDLLLLDAKRILAPPRLLPVLIRKNAKKGDLRDVAVVEQMIRPARNQMDNASLRARVSVLLHCAEKMPTLFAQGLRDDQWAAMLRRSPRWFAAAKKAGKQKKGDPNGK